MKKYLKILGITISSIIGLVIVAGVIGSIIDDLKSKKTTSKVSTLDVIEHEIYKVDNQSMYDFYIEKLEEIRKNGGTDSIRVDSIFQNREYIEEMMKQRELDWWVEHAKKEFPKQFTEYDGSNKYLVFAIKKLMNDPDSFEHDETRWEYGSGFKYIRVQMTYRGKNGFGALVREKVTVKIDIKGNILEIE